ncbi:Rha family transcriptional regulator [Clostridium grantii]|uniref:Phage regulatory protein, rha family n=1 Tax=Clostridium grantii DSM 8605 TaxID=1121316 RepID=A0A1M5XMJ6_9CLOT|nr:Rha family transcriptional regulator [Clostridium grantii]SHI00979.1 phage regulatory protein, rha family [Clostridium grantii DSM 8605]
MEKRIDVITKEGVLLVSSSQVAENFNKRRRNVVRDIDNLISNLGGAQNCAGLFSEIKIENDQNKQSYREFLLTKEGFSILVMGFTGYEAIQWKLKYIEAFNKMEQALRSSYKGVSKEIEAIFLLDKKTSVIEKRITEVEETAYILPFQKKALIKARSKKVLTICGGTYSIYYKDKSFRGKVYQDIARNLRQIYNINEYDAIPRNKFDEAVAVVESYVLPIHLQYEMKRIEGGSLNE